MSTQECPRAKSEMTPCYVKDGDVTIAYGDGGEQICVGCEVSIATLWWQKFTPDEVVALYGNQTRTDRHPFTCPNHGDANHRPELDYLFPTVRGWICPFCEFTQDWAHDFMKK